MLHDTIVSIHEDNYESVVPKVYERADLDDT